jgi:hypothetical protein
MKPQTSLPSRRRTSLALAALTTAALTSGLLVGTGATAGPGTGDGGKATAELRRAAQPGATQLVVVHARTQRERTQVVNLGVDATTKVTPRGLEVILHGPSDAKLLRDAGFTWSVKVDDLGAQLRADARQDARYAKAVRVSPLPSGRTSYRYLADYNRELTELRRKYPRLVKPLTLHRRTVGGRRVRGIEITTSPRKVADGKPVFLMLGAHHSREWPSSEHAMEYAYDLLENYRGVGVDPRARRIVDNTRTIIVPVVNPDGFRISRNAERLGDFSLFDYEMKRKNCSVSRFTPAEYRGGTCANNPAGRLRGTDLNRNYPGFWGGPGASANWDSDVYRGDRPGGAPEVANVRRLISQRQVTTMITNHTYSNLILRPPAIAATGKSPDEPVYKALGDRMAAANGYANQASFQLYDTSGSTEDWSYWNTGGLGFTFEIGPDGFHPVFREAVVAEYVGLAPAAGAGRGGNREAFYRASMATLNDALHSRIVGRAPRGHMLEIRKRFISATSPVIDEEGNEGAQRYYADVLTSRLRPVGGRFEWDVNPSTRPLVAGRYGREAEAPPQEDVTLTNPAGVPAEGQVEEATFTVEGLPEADNGTATVTVEWPGTADPEDVDWDVYVYDSAGNQVASAASLDNPEEAVLVDPVPGEYTVVVENYAGGTAATDWTGSVSFAGPTPPAYTGLKEAWMLSCTDARTGRVVGTRAVVVDRGGVARVGAICSREQFAR